MGYELKGLRDDCFIKARRLGDYQSMSIEELVAGYCQAFDEFNEDKKDQYMGALLLRFWGKINKLYIENQTLQLSHTDYADWIAMSIMMACAPENRVWLKNPKIKPETAINQTLATRFKAQAYYEANLDIKKANYQTVSLATPLGNGSSDDEDATLMDILPDENSSLDYVGGDVATKHIIQSYITKNKIVEAIIFDAIAYNDVEKITSETVKATDSSGNDIKYKRYYHEFKPSMLVKILGDLPEGFSEYFAKKYSVNQEMLDAAVSDIRKCNNTKLYKFLRKALADLKGDFANYALD